MNEKILLNRGFKINGENEKVKFYILEQPFIDENDYFYIEVFFFKQESRYQFYGIHVERLETKETAILTIHDLQDDDLEWCISNINKKYHTMF